MISGLTKGLSAPGLDDRMPWLGVAQVVLGVFFTVVWFILEMGYDVIGTPLFLAAVAFVAGGVLWWLGMPKLLQLATFVLGVFFLWLFVKEYQGPFAWGIVIAAVGYILGTWLPISSGTSRWVKIAGALPLALVLLYVYGTTTTVTVYVYNKDDAQHLLWAYVKEDGGRELTITVDDSLLHGAFLTNNDWGRVRVSHECQLNMYGIRKSNLYPVAYYGTCATTRSDTPEWANPHRG